MLRVHHQIPVHPDDRSLLGMRWQGQLYCDATLPFGLRSAPIIFSAVADALEWVVKVRGGTHIFHYVDDFVFVGPPRSPKCSRDLQLFMDTCSELGINKTEGPSTCLTILGIEIDTMAMELRLPQAKLARLAETVRSWRGKRSGKRRELESLVGLLQHASQVVRPGRIFLRHLYSLLASTSAFKPHYTTRLNSEAQADIEWWSTFVQRWNGRSILCPVKTSSPDVEMWSDASGSWGCGAVWGSRWLQLRWDTLPIASAAIAAKEFFPIIVAAVVWGRFWRGSTVCCYCDNVAVVEVLNRQAAKEELLCHQLRSLFFISAKFDFDIVARHTPGVDNVAADALSRNMMSTFRLQVPSAALMPEPIPPSLTLSLGTPALSWKSPNWTTWLSSILGTH